MKSDAEYVAIIRKQIRVTDSECWEFQGYIKPDGYGQVGRNRLTHRLMWSAVNGPIVDGLHMDHLCRNRACCNPAHLEEVTPRVNVLRGISPVAGHAHQTACIHGHPLDEANTYSEKGLHRRCRACRARRQGEYRARQKDAA